MSVRSLLLAAVACGSLAGCALPKLEQAPPYPSSCVSPNPATAIDVLVLSYRIPDCRRAKFEWSPFAARSPIYSVADLAGGETIVADKAWDAYLPKKGEPAPIIVIHGYNNSQGDAIKRAGAISILMCTTVPDDNDHCIRERPVIALAWPSLSKMMPFFWDEAQNEAVRAATTERIVELIHDFPGAILVAHSMGNRMLLDIVAEANRKELEIGQLIMASPDVDRRIVERLLNRPGGMGYATTLYGSLHDQPLSASWRGHGYPRAGDFSRWVTGRRPADPISYADAKNVAVVDTTRTHSDVKHHSDFVESADGAFDLCHQLRGNLPPPGRLRLKESKHHYGIGLAPIPPGLCRDLAERAVRQTGKKWKPAVR